MTTTSNPSGPPGVAHSAALGQVLELTVLLAEDMERSLRARGLTRSRTHLIWVLRESGPVTQRVLADALGVSARNITGLVDALVETGFVTREPHPSDRRATLVTFTEHGRAVAEGLVEEETELAGRVFGPVDAHDLATFSSVLDQVLATVRTLIAEETAAGPPAVGDPR